MTTQPTVKLAPSILSADMARLGEQIAEADQAGGDYIHVDVMDGRFVPNLTIGPIVVEWARSWTKKPLDVHLMIVEPERLIPDFAKAGANIITVHAEACPHLHRIIGQIKELGVRAGVALNPGTPLSAIEEVLPDLDLLLVMSVNPGFPAQKFIPATLDKLKRARRLLDEGGYEAELEVDGGVNANTVGSVVEAGARVLVAGSAIFNARQSVSEAMAHLRQGFEKGVN
ncbi:MAG: ribulose-phosphate 3-epimerase [Chloroflexi bacterium]|jgi:ribulose-phosphate 3-epimerase|nr:MAG: ribulose-phosphate 3-epimerase [Chloroflexota bacterium]